METAYCREHEHRRTVRPIVGTGRAESHRDGVWQLSVWLDCGAHGNIVTTTARLKRMEWQAQIAARLAA